MFLVSAMLCIFKVNNLPFAFNLVYVETKSIVQDLCKINGVLCKLHQYCITASCCLVSS